MACNPDDNPALFSDNHDLLSVYQGSVGDGPVVGATVIVRDKDGGILTSKVSDAFANYKVSVKAKRKSYPLTIEAIGGIDLVTNSAPTFELVSVVLHPSDKIANINPFSSFIVRTAEAMGGLTDENIEQATAVVLREFNFGFDEGLMLDPIATKVTESEVALIVKVSESLGELVRRTTLSVAENGYSFSENDVVSVIAADLVDGVLDGKGEYGANAEVALRAKVIAGAIVLEALPNLLRVNSIVATDALDASIVTIMPDASPMPNTGQVVSTTAMIAQLETAVKIGRRIAPSSALSGLMESIGALVGITPETAANLLPVNASELLDDGLNAITMLSADEIVELHVPLSGEINHPPVISGTARGSVEEGAAYYFEPESSDADGDPLTYAITNRPSWAEFNVATGVLSGKPGFDHAGSFNDITISVTDGEAIAVLDPFSITVEHLNRPPLITGVPLTSVTAGTTYEFTPVTIDHDGDLLAFSIVNKPIWSEFNLETGQLSGQPDNNHVGFYQGIEIKVSDGGEVVSLPLFSIAVGLNNSSPMISGVPAGVVAEGSVYSFIPSVHDSDGDTLTFSIINRPDWAQFNSNTGLLSGSPGYSESGVYNNIQIGVSDGYVTASLPLFSITVTNINRAPTISGPPVTAVDEGVSYSFTPVSADADGDTLTFSVLNQPAWASLNTATGALSGVPGYTESGMYDNIILRVSDGQESMALAPFSITVTNINRAPTISGTPVTAVEEGVSYSFMPVSADADGDALTFSVLNQPPWASLNLATGELSGVPGNVDVGSYLDIMISVFDGEQLVSLDGFDLVVSASQTPVTGSATLSWVAPATRVDGSEFLLSEIGGYRIYYGINPDNLALLVDLAAPTATHYIVEGLSAGIHYFSVSVYDAAGSESERSPVRSKAI